MNRKNLYSRYIAITTGMSHCNAFIIIYPSYDTLYYYLIFY